MPHRPVRAILNDQLVVYVSADKAMVQRPHGVGQDIPADGLYDVLDEFRTVGFDAAPFLLGIDAQISDGLAAELVLTDAGLHIGQAATGRQRDEQYTAVHLEADTADLLRNPHLNGGLHRFIYYPPVGRDVGIGFAPHSDQRLKLVFRQAHVQRTHGLQRANGTAIAEGELSNFAFLAEVCVLAVLFDRYAEHSGCTFAVDVPAVVEHVGTPLLPGQV